MKKFYIAISVVILVTAVILRIEQWQEGKLKEGLVKINNTTIKVEVAETPLAREKGLSGREKLDQNKGMLFIFPQKDYYSFWMKEMKFPIDIIWISDNRVVDIAYDLPLQASEFLKTYQPKEPVNFVLEVNAGFARNYNIKIGDRVEIEY
jgi:uncharacterized membrane protein (UPF0127 family)